MSRKKNAHHLHKNTGAMIFTGVVFVVFVSLAIASHLHLIAWQIPLQSVPPLFLILAGLMLIEANGWLSAMAGIFASSVFMAIVAAVLLLSAPGVSFGRVSFTAGADSKPYVVRASEQTALSVVHLSVIGGNVSVNQREEDIVSVSSNKPATTLHVDSRQDGATQMTNIDSLDSNASDLGLELGTNVPVQLQAKLTDVNGEWHLAGIDAELIDVTMERSHIDLMIGDRRAETLITLAGSGSSVRISLPRTVNAVVVDAGGEHDMNEEGAARQTNTVRIEFTGDPVDLSLDWY